MFGHRHHECGGRGRAQYAHRGRDFGHGGGGGFGGGGFGFGGPGGGFGFRRGHRARKGDIRSGILALLAEQPRNGYQIMQELETRSNGMWHPSPGSIYPALQQLEDEGLVTAETAGGGRTFQLTEAGIAHVAAHHTADPAPWAAMGDDHREAFALFGEVKHIGMAIGQIAHLGNRTQYAEAQRILAQTRKALYRILAEDTPEESPAPSTPIDPTKLPSAE